MWISLRSFKHFFSILLWCQQFNHDITFWNIIIISGTFKNYFLFYSLLYLPNNAGLHCPCKNLNIKNKISVPLNRFPSSNNQFYIFYFNVFLSSDSQIFIGSMKIYISIFHMYVYIWWCTLNVSRFNCPVCCFATL